MNKTLILTSAMAIAATAAIANPFKDVPFSHWAYDAVNALNEKDIFKGFTDKTFKGEQPVTRYQIAAVVARMLAVYAENAKEGLSGGLNQDDLQLLEKLTVEFADDLTILGIKTSNLEKDMASIKADVSDLKGYVASVNEKIDNGLIDKVKVSGDMLIRHEDGLKGVNGQNTMAQFRLKFEAKVTNNVEAVVRNFMYVDNYGANLGGAAGNVAGFDHGISTTNQNIVDVAYLNLKGLVLKGDLKIGRDMMTHGSALIMDDFVDAITYSKRSGIMDIEINGIYDLTNGRTAPDSRTDRPIWNINFDVEAKNNNLHLGYYSQDDYIAAIDKGIKNEFVEFDAKGKLIKDINYEAAYVLAKRENALEANTKDASGNLYHISLGYDIKSVGLKLAYTSGDDEYLGGITDSVSSNHYNQRTYDGVESPLEDIAYVGLNINKGGCLMQDAENLKIQLSYGDIESEHYFRIAYDMYEQDDKGFNAAFGGTAGEVKDEANILTLEYRYQLSKNTRLRFGYHTLDGKKASKDVDEDIFYAEIFSKF